MNLTHSCKRVAELVSQGLDEPLDWLDWMRLRMHLSMCDDCRHVAQQLVALKSITAELFDLEPECGGRADPPERASTAKPRTD
jgi:predicted anti-sigma-YlaC factor YlaD